MHIRLVNVSVIPQFITTFITETKQNQIESIKENGNIRFDVIQNETDPSSFILYEAYENENAAAFHKTTPHYKKWRTNVETMMAQPRKAIAYHAIAVPELHLT